MTHIAEVCPRASEAPLIKGWCPGALQPMLSGDGLLMRPKILGSRLTLAQAEEIAGVSRDYGNGSYRCFSARADAAAWSDGKMLRPSARCVSPAQGSPRRTWAWSPR